MSSHLKTKILDNGTEKDVHVFKKYHGKVNVEPRGYCLELEGMDLAKNIKPYLERRNTEKLDFQLYPNNDNARNILTNDSLVQVTHSPRVNVNKAWTVWAEFPTSSEKMKFEQEIQASGLKGYMWSEFSTRNTMRIGFSSAFSRAWFMRKYGGFLHPSSTEYYFRHLDIFKIKCCFLKEKDNNGKWISKVIYNPAVQDFKVYGKMNEWALKQSDQNNFNLKAHFEGQMKMEEVWDLEDGDGTEYDISKLYDGTENEFRGWLAFWKQNDIFFKREIKRAGPQGYVYEELSANLKGVLQSLDTKIDEMQQRMGEAIHRAQGIGHGPSQANGGTLLAETSQTSDLGTTAGTIVTPVVARLENRVESRVLNNEPNLIHQPLNLTQHQEPPVSNVPGLDLMELSQARVNATVAPTNAAAVVIIDTPAATTSIQNVEMPANGKQNGGLDKNGVAQNVMNNQKTGLEPKNIGNPIVAKELAKNVEMQRMADLQKKYEELLTFNKKMEIEKRNAINKNKLIEEFAENQKKNGQLVNRTVLGILEILKKKTNESNQRFGITTNTENKMDDTSYIPVLVKRSETAGVNSISNNGTDNPINFAGTAQTYEPDSYSLSLITTSGNDSATLAPNMHSTAQFNKSSKFKIPEVPETPIVKSNKRKRKTRSAASTSELDSTNGSNKSGPTRRRQKRKPKDVHNTTSLSAIESDNDDLGNLSTAIDSSEFETETETIDSKLVGLVTGDDLLNGKNLVEKIPTIGEIKDSLTLGGINKFLTENDEKEKTHNHLDSQQNEEHGEKLALNNTNEDGNVDSSGGTIVNTSNSANGISNTMVKQKLLENENVELEKHGELDNNDEDSDDTPIITHIFNPVDQKVPNKTGNNGTSDHTPVMVKTEKTD